MPTYRPTTALVSMTKQHAFEHVGLQPGLISPRGYRPLLVRTVNSEKTYFFANAQVLSCMLGLRSTTLLLMSTSC